MTQNLQKQHWLEPEEQNVANKLARLRIKLKIGSLELAHMVGIDEQELLSYEQADEPIPASILAMISIVLGVDMEYFFDEDEQKESNPVLELALNNAEEEKLYVN